MDLDAPLLAYWQKFCKQRQLNEQQLYDAFAFGDRLTEQDDLAQLVRQGIKRGTTSALALYTLDTPKPETGNFSIILDGHQQVSAVIQTTQIDCMPFKQVTAEMARIEGDKS